MSQFDSFDTTVFGGFTESPLKERISPALKVVFYISCGAKLGAGSTDETEEYDIAADSWSDKSTALIARQSGDSGGSIGKIGYEIGGVQAIGGPPESFNHAYDSSDDTRAVKTSPPTAKANAMIVDLDGKLYLQGGHIGLTTSSAMDEYDTGTDAWTGKTARPHELERGSAARLKNNKKGYYQAGLDAVGTTIRHDLYDQSDDAWTAKADLIGEASWDDHVAANIIVGSSEFIHCTGHSNNDDDNIRYDAGDDSWSQKKGHFVNSLDRSTGHHQVNNFFHQINGTVTGNPIEHKRYDGDADSWTNKALVDTQKSNTFGFSLRPNA